METSMNNRKAFTIIELLTSMVIIVLLVGILLPSITMVRRMAREAAEKAQLLVTIPMALDAFKQDYGDYPPSSAYECPGLPPEIPPHRDYPGSMKLAEALLGWDLMGFDPNSVWRRDGYTGTAIPVGEGGSYDPDRVRGDATLFERRGPYLDVATTKVFRIGISASDANGLYDFSSLIFLTPLEPKNFVICDVFGVRRIPDRTGKIVAAGAPILYFKANTASKTLTDPGIQNRIYNYWDNQLLIALGKLTASGAAGKAHPLDYPEAGDYPVFYNSRFSYNPATLPGYGGAGVGYGIVDPKATTNPAYPWPYRPDSYILISAGYDGFYGTADDIHNY